MSAEKEVEIPTERELYEGKERKAIIAALNILGCWHSPLTHLKKKSKQWYALQGEDYEWGEAYKTLYGALGIDLDLSDPKPAYEEYAKLRQEAWLRDD